MGKESTRTAWISVFGVIAVAVIGGAVTIWTTQRGKEGNGGGTQDPPPPPKIWVMGPLERGVNRQGMDFSANPIITANEELCAEECRKEEACKAMTYVISMKTCWLKNGVPAPYPPGGSDYVSSVKVSQ